MNGPRNHGRMKLKRPLLATGGLCDHVRVSSPLGHSGPQGEDLESALKETLVESGLASPPLPSGGQA